MEGIRALTVFVGAFEKWIVDFFVSLQGWRGWNFVCFLKKKSDSPQPQPPLLA